MRVTQALIAGKWRINLLLVFLMSCLLMAGSAAQMKQGVSDAAKYQCYAHAFWFGGGEFVTYATNISICHLLIPQAAPVFHTLPREYPLLALVPFSLPLLAPPAWYQFVFGILMVLLAAVLYQYLARVGPPGASLAFAIFLLLGGLGTTASRFDLVPAALTLFCLTSANHHRYQSAYFFLALATMLKFYPLLLLPPLLLSEQQSLDKAVACGTARAE